jgi:hypothetical protein
LAILGNVGNRGVVGEINEVAALAHALGFEVAKLEMRERRMSHRFRRAQ